MSCGLLHTWAASPTASLGDDRWLRPATSHPVSSTRQLLVRCAVRSVARSRERRGLLELSALNGVTSCPPTPRLTQPVPVPLAASALSANTADASSHRPAKLSMVPAMLRW